MPDILAIVSKAVFDKDARAFGKPLKPGDVWAVDRYNSNSKPLGALKDGGRIFLVTVRPPDEQLWFLGVVESPKFNGSAWVSASKNTLPVTNITSLRKTIAFESGKGMSKEKGVLGMSLQTPRALAASDVKQILALVAGTPISSAPTQAVSSPKPARVIGGKYEVLRKLGEGGMGAVYEARNTATGRRVAIKEIVGDALRDNPNVIERFQREARATGAIETQHIAPVLDAGTDPETDHPYLVLELLQGEDVQQLLARVGRLPEDVALKIVAQAAVGLARAHEAGVIHRDIKPANLFLARRDGGEIVIKLLDFGIARVREQLATESSRVLTTTGLMLGSPLYMSPEQALGSKTLDHRTDLWSLGVVLHEMLTGSTPHAGSETLGALFLAICTKPAPPVTGVREDAARVVGKLLELDPKRRYASADELAEDVKRSLASVALHEEELTRLADKRREERDAIELAKTTPAEPPPMTNAEDEAS